MELCIALMVIAILVLALVGAIHLLAVATRPSHHDATVHERWQSDRGRSHPKASQHDDDELTQLRTTLRKLAEFRDVLLIDEQTFERLHHHISVRRQQLRAEANQPVPQVEAILEALPASVNAPDLPVVQPAESAEARPIPPPPPRRSWGELLASFMEERHILWGELIGGLLIVGCSVALVLSLWQTLQQIPMFPFLILAALTSALFGTGRYTFRRWKLEATSRGLLVIALLLVPLNFMVLAGLSAQTTDIRIELATKVAAIALFTWLVFRAGTLLFSTNEAVLLALAVVGAAVSPLPVPRLFDPESLLWLLPAIWAVACFAFSIGLFLRRRWTELELEQRPAWEILGFLGLAIFPLAVALVFIGIWAASHRADLGLVLHRLSLPIVIAGAPVAAVGLFVQRRSKAGLPIVAGTGVAIVGMLIHAEAMVASWPEPIVLILVGLAIALTWTAAAVIFRLPLAHVAALIGLTSAVLAMVHITGPLDWRMLLSGDSGIALAILAISLALVADQLRVRDWWAHGQMHALFAAILMASALLLVGREAEQLPWRAVGVGAAAMTACLILERRWGMPILGHIGTCLAPATTVALLHGLLPGQQAIWATLLAVEAVGWSLIRPPRRAAVTLAITLAIVLAIGFAPFIASWHAATLVLLALVALMQSHQLRFQALAWIGSGLLFLSLGHLLYVQPKEPLPLAMPLALLIHAIILLPALLVRRSPNLGLVARSLGDSAKVSTLAAAIALGLHYDPARLNWLAVGAGLLAALWLIYALIESEAGWYTASQFATAMAAILGVAAVLHHAGRMSEISQSLDLFALALSALILIWTLLRIGLRHPIWDDAKWPAFERVLLGALISGLALLAVVRVIPGVVAEFGGPGDTPAAIGPFWRIPGGQWLVLAAISVPLFCQFWAIRRIWRHAFSLAGLLILYLTIPLLLAPDFHGRLAAASALRWSMGIACLIGCVPFWFRDSILDMARRFGIRASDSEKWLVPRVISGLRFSLLAVAGGIPLLITLTTMANLIAGQSPAGPADGTFFKHLGFTWSHGVPLALVAAGMVGHALRDRSSEYAFGAGLLVKFLVCGGFLVSVATAHLPFDDRVWRELGQRFAIAAGAWAIAWLVASRQLGRFQNVERDWQSRPSLWWNIQFGLAALSTAAPIILAAIWLAVSFDIPPAMATIGFWPAWLALVLVLAAADMRSRFAGRDDSGSIIGVGAMLAVVLAATRIPPEQHGWAFRMLMLGWAGCAVLWSALSYWKPSDGLLNGLTSATALAVALAMKDLFIHAEPNRLLRLIAAVAIALTAVAAALFRNQKEQQRAMLASTALAFVVASFAALGIGLVPPEASALWLHRSVALLAALSLCTVAYAVAWHKSGRWAIAAGKLAPNLGLIAASVLVLSVVQQGFLFNPQTMRTPLHGAEVGLLVLATIGLMAAAILFAVRPEIDPFEVPDRWLEGYIYGCEVLLVLLFLHLRFNVPGLFPKIEAQAWAFVIMAIAFAGVGLSELLRYLRLDVFVRPLERTGLFLPLLPLLMFWMKPPQPLRDPIIAVFPGSKPLLGFFDQIPTDYGRYSILWFLFGLLYASLAISRQSFRHALFAALAANVGIWSLLWHHEISMAAHPQLWLVPLALIILVSEQYQHRRIRHELSIGLRYTGLGLLYLSSTADFFLAGLGNSVVLPLALALLSIAGVLIGILLRIRSYLFLGTAFLALVVFSMIWHAAVDLSQTWLWWASGILLGVAILALFAIFERRRQSVVHAIEELRTWR